MLAGKDALFFLVAHARIFNNIHVVVVSAEFAYPLRQRRQLGCHVSCRAQVQGHIHTASVPSIHSLGRVSGPNKPLCVVARMSLVRERSTDLRKPEITKEYVQRRVHKDIFGFQISVNHPDRVQKLLCSRWLVCTCRAAGSILATDQGLTDLGGNTQHFVVRNRPVIIQKLPA